MVWGWMDTWYILGAVIVVAAALRSGEFGSPNFDVERFMDRLKEIVQKSKKK